MTPLAERLSARTLELCRVPSPISEERALCDELQRWAGERLVGWPVRRVSHSLVIGERATDRPTVALVGHLDTVPYFPEDQPPHREGSRIVGKGASDMKGGLAVALELCERLPPKTPLQPLLVLYEREEGPYFENGLEGLWAAQALPRVDLALCLEPTDGAVQAGCVGSLHATVRFRGRAAHSARPWEGRNAIHAAGPLLAALEATAPREARESGLAFREVYSVTRLSGGKARNVVADLCELNLNYRFAPGKSVEAAEAELRALCERYGAAEVLLTDRAPSGPVCLENPLVARLLAQGLRAEPKQAWTDVARLAQWGIDAVNFGPGQPSQAHQAGEWAEGERLAEVYLALERLFTAGA
ncbi:MAG: succinyl-diaminopimelate desuccinylase [Deltaproteobacteria bacterium]